MRRSIPYGCVARRLNSLFALLAPCHAGASTPENVNLFLGEPLSETVSQAQAPIGPKITVGEKGGKAYSKEKPVIGNIPVPQETRSYNGVVVYIENGIFILVSEIGFDRCVDDSGSDFYFGNYLTPSLSFFIHC
jgi:hypothetical protein